MAIFNPNFFTDPGHALNTEFGIPSCIVNLTAGALGLMSNKGLGQIATAIQAGKTNARTAISQLFEDTFTKWGILSYDMADGKLSLFTENSPFGIDLSFASGLAEVNANLGELEDLYNQGVALAGEVGECIDQFKSWMDSKGPSELTGVGGLGGGSDNAYTESYRQAEFAIAQNQAQAAVDFIDSCNQTLLNIGEVLASRSLEEEAEIAGGSCSLAGYDDEQSCVEAGGVWTPSDDPIFRLTYGAPVSKLGVFILSEDGIYYDSQTTTYNGKDIPSPSDIGVVLNAQAWKLDYAPNLGGKGTIVTLDDVNKYVDTFFDPNKIDNTLTTYYDVDHFLSVLESQKQKLLFDTSAQILELLSGGYNENSALIINHRQSLLAVISSFNEKIRKRKKQIEIAVKASSEFGAITQFPPGHIPINDFSYLSSVNLNVSLEQQQRLIFESGSVEDIVLPIKPIFVRSYGSEAAQLNLPFSVPTIGVGSILINNGVSSITMPSLSITDTIVTDSLFGVYNFLEAKGVPPGPFIAPPTEFSGDLPYLPDPTIFGRDIGSGEGYDDPTVGWMEAHGSINCAQKGVRYNAQLLGKNSKLFASGVSIPYLTGMVTIDPTTKKIVDYGSVCRLPDGDAFQNFLYNKSGGTFECWLHMPNYGVSSNFYESGESTVLNPNPGDGRWGDYNYYKIILANENVGGEIDTNVSAIFTAQGTDSVRGMLMGFTRDPSIYSKSLIVPGSDTDPGANANIHVSSTTASSCFFIAPTMAINNNAVTFTPKGTDCISEGFAKMTIDDKLTVGSKKFTDVSEQFMHLAVSFDTSSDECRVYLDSQLMATSSLSEVFGVQKYQPPYLPTFKDPADSFEYGTNNVNQALNTNYFDNGPVNDPFFTPWILGGGWTDGMPFNSTGTSGGFMGNHHGWMSGLGGHLGSVKFYLKPLSTTEVKTNYDAQKGYFKNILT